MKRTTAAFDSGATLRWQINRLRCMTPGEIGYRSIRFLAASLSGLWPRRSRVPTPALDVPATPWLPLHDVAHVTPRPYLEAAARIAAGRLTILSLADFDYGAPPRWNRHPQSAYEWPLAPGLRLPLKNEQHGDIKYLWEPNRHLHLVTLAQAYRLSGDAVHAHALIRLLDSWFEQCPFPLGPNWASPMEAALRLINWSLCWQLLGAAASPLFADAAGGAFRVRWLDSIYRHVDFVRSNLSLYSSANNHLIGELTGIFIAGQTWPYWKNVQRWAGQAQRRLTRECLSQNATDGVNLEQASSYHLFVFEYLLLAGVCARAGPGDFPAAYWQRLEAMSEYLAFLGSFGCGLPAIGDADDAAVARLSPAESPDMRHALLGTAAVLFQRNDLACAAQAVGEHATWLLGARASTDFAALAAGPAITPPRADFPAGGYHGLGLTHPGRLRALFDCGPLGYTRIAAHGHADALSMLLWLDGRPFLIDAGTYCYNDQPEWRAYFRGTAAHNTVRIDSADQSVSGGPFMWLDKAAARRVACASPPQRETICGLHDGYKRLIDPVTHERMLELTRMSEALAVTDIVHCKQSHLVEICWHFAEGIAVAIDGNALTASSQSAAMRVEMHEGAGAWHLYRGQEEPIWGWQSPRFGVKVASTTAVWRVEIRGTSRFRTSFQPIPPEEDTDDPH